MRPGAEWRYLENRSSWSVKAPAVRPMVDSGQIQMGNIGTDQQVGANVAGLVVVSSAATDPEPVMARTFGTCEGGRRGFMVKQAAEMARVSRWPRRFGWKQQGDPVVVQDSTSPDWPRTPWRGKDMNVVVVIAVVMVVLIVVALSIRVVTQYEKGVWFRLGRVIGVREPGLRFIIPVIDRLWKVSLRIVTMPIQSQGIITRDNVSVDIAAVAYFRVVDAVKSVVVIENVGAAIDQIAQTTLRNVVGQHTLDEALAETEVINANIRQILDVITLEWGVEVTLVELKDIQLPDSMKRAMARQAEAEREKRAKIIAAEGESLAAAALGDASDTMMAHPLALQLRNLQTLIELGVDKNTTVVFPAPLMSTIAELGAFLAREGAAATEPEPQSPIPIPAPTAAGPNGTSTAGSRP